MNRMVEFSVEQAQQFLSAWAGHHSRPTTEAPWAGWKDFFTGWEQLAPAEAAVQRRPSLDCESFKPFAQAFAEAYGEYCRSGAALNVWRTAGLGHDELRNSEVLRWVLDKFGDHGHGSAILERVVELAGSRQPEQWPAKVTAEMVRNSNYRTRTESLPLDDLESRIDIEIESRAFLIFIEVKVRAPETGDQLKRYVDLARKKAGGRPTMLIFLTPNGRLPKDGDLHEEVIPLSWKHIAYALEKHTAGDGGNSVTSHIFRQFAAHARYLA